MEPKDSFNIAFRTTGGTIGGVEKLVRTPSGKLEKVIFPSEGAVERTITCLYDNWRLHIDKNKVTSDIRPVVYELDSRLSGTKMNMDSTDMSPADRLEVANSAFKAIKEADAVVITMGTDTLDQLAYLLAIKLVTDKPVIITGSMRTPELEIADKSGGITTIRRKQSDAPKNLRNAILTGIEFAKLEIGGVFVTFDRRVMPAAWIFEPRPGDPINGFSSTVGNIAIIKDGKLEINSYIKDSLVGSGKKTTPSLNTKLYTNVATVSLSDPSYIARRNAHHPTDGLLVISYGTGGLSRDFDSAIREIAQAKPVVMSSFVPGDKAGRYAVNLAAENAGAIIGFGLYHLDQAILMHALGNRTTSRVNVHEIREIFQHTQQVLIEQVRPLLKQPMAIRRREPLMEALREKSSPTIGQRIMELRRLFVRRSQVKEKPRNENSKIIA